MVERLKTEYRIQVEWRPYYLQPNAPPEGSELPAYIRARMASSQERLKQMAQALGMPMVFSTWVPNTRLAHEATEYARAQGKHIEFHHAVFRLYYGEGQNIGQWSVLQTAAQEVGLDPEDMQHQVTQGVYTAQVGEQIALAQVMQISGVPTHILNERYAIVGAQPYEVFQKTMARLADEGHAPHAKL